MTFDWKKPDYIPIMRERMERMAELRKDELKLAKLKLHYRDNPADFINDWGMTFDPRNASKKLPTMVPFKLFDKQREWVDWFLERRELQEDGISEKSRDMGLSWLATATAATLCLFNKNIVGGFGSRKEALVDKAGDPDSLFWKARMFVELLPREFRGTFDPRRDSSHLIIRFPETGSILRGEAGDNIGRGGRADFYFTDEDAFIARCLLVDAALSQNTNCRQRISSVNGMNNPFAVQRHSGNVSVFTFHWRNDPRKDDAWYDRQKKRLDPIILAQEVDLSYSASVSGVVIPQEWVQAAVNAAEVLGIKVSGVRRGALDVADEGIDKNAYAGRHGISLNWLNQWTGKGSDIYDTTVQAFHDCRFNGHEGFDYDADGLGAGVRGDARVINEKQLNETGLPPIEVNPFRGSGSVLDPESTIESVDNDNVDQLDRLNEDFFANAKAQAWWALRLRFQRTYRAVEAHKRGETWTYDPDSLISLDPNCPMLAALMPELSQPTWKPNDAGKMVVNKTPDGTKSPNLADAVMILFAPRTIHLSLFEALRR